MLDILVEWQVDADGNVSGPVKLDGIDQILMSAANQNRDVVGSFHGNGQWEPFLFRSVAGHHIELGSLAGQSSGSARGVNDRSPDDGSLLAVGGSWGQRRSDSRAVLWSVGASSAVAGPVDLGLPSAMVTRTRPLRTAGFVSAEATSINNEGWVVGWSERSDRTFFATLWRPSENGGDDGGDNGNGGDDGGNDDCRPHPRTGVCR